MTTNTNIHSSKIQTGFGFFDLSTGELIAYGTRRNVREIRSNMNNPENYSGVRRVNLKVSNTETV